MSRFHTYSSPVTAFLAWTVVLLGPSVFSEPSAAAQEKPPYTLILEGKELQNCIVSVRYFRNRQLTKTVVSRVTLVGGQAEESVESQHEGIEIYLQSASTPLTARLVAQGKSLDQGNTDKSGIAKLSFGKIGRAPFQPIAIELTRRESSLVNALAKAMADESSVSSLVSDATSAVIDGPCLNVLLRELKSLIGAPVDASNASEGWLAYGKPESGRNLAGAIQCSGGVCGFRISLEKNKIVNVVPNCAALPDNYFREPIELQVYVRQAKLLTQSLFAGDAKRAHGLYSPKFQSQVSPEQLAQLSQVVQQRYGKSLESVELKRSELLDYNFEQRSQLLNIDLLLETDTGARCISRTAFSIPTGRNLVGKAHLGAINVFQVFQSSHPQDAQVTEKLLREISQGMQAQDYLELYPSELADIAKKEETQSLLSRLAENLAGVEPEIDFDQWTVSATEVLTSASGPVQFEGNDYFLEVQFNGQHQLLGFSFYGPSMSESTLGLFAFDPKVQETSEQFWTLLLKEDADAAYAMLHPEFQKQFSLEELKTQLNSPQNESSPLTGVTTGHLRLSNNPLRPLPLMVSSFLTASYEQGNPLESTCELAMQLPENAASGMIYDFSNEFEADFPVATIPTQDPAKDGLQALANAFINNSSTDLLALVDPNLQTSIDRFALEAYMSRLREIGGKMVAGEVASRTVEFSLGKNATVATPCY